ncbi:HAD family hydrolase [Vulgatibacter sp.]|uniref:HAD family hydrolase n=1 Tax=Vulgatibacter sp. TaxID=1971226 RepID=UPI0035696707
MLRAVLFDLDDTLLPEAEAIRAALAATCGPAEERLEVPPGTLAEALEAVASARYRVLDRSGFDSRFGVTWEECLWGRFGPASQKQLPGLPALAETLRHLVWTDALAALGRRSPLAPLELDARYAAERRVRLRPFPDAEGLLASLRDRALALACVTNGAAEVQREKLVASGLGAFFDEVLISGEEGIGKPDPAILRRACDRLGVEPHEAIYVGNSRLRDVAAARAAGMRSVLVERFEPAEPAAAPAPDRVIYEVHGLLGLVDGWRWGRAFRVIAPSRTPVAVDEPACEEGRCLTRVGPEADELRPAVRGRTGVEAIEAALRNLRARSGADVWRYELGEPVDWDALLR